MQLTNWQINLKGIVVGVLLTATGGLLFVSPPSSAQRGAQSGLYQLVPASDGGVFRLNVNNGMVEYFGPQCKGVSFCGPTAAKNEQKINDQTTVTPESSTR